MSAGKPLSRTADEKALGSPQPPGVRLEQEKQGCQLEALPGRKALSSDFWAPVPQGWPGTRAAPLGQASHQEACQLLCAGKDQGISFQWAGVTVLPDARGAGSPSHICDSHSIRCFSISCTSAMDSRRSSLNFFRS